MTNPTHTKAVLQLPPARITRYERSLQLHVARNPRLVFQCDELDIQALHSDTLRILEIAAEFPAACELAGIFSVAAMLGEPEGFLQLLDEIRALPHWAVTDWPSLTKSLAQLRKAEPLKPLGALRQWREEVRRGVHGQRIDLPSSWILDDLYRAACFEAYALEADRRGEKKLARSWMSEAVRVLADTQVTNSIAA